MNRRRLQKVLSAKHNAFCDSIKDKELRDRVRKGAYITGGSIVSLLTGEQVKDYDYYFKDEGLTTDVAKYYCKEFKALNPDKQSPEVRTDEDTGQVKIFLPSTGAVAEDDVIEYEDGDQMQEAIEAEGEEEKEKYRPIFLSANAITLSNSVQLVIRFYGEPEEVHKNYDFIHCMNYWLPNKYDGKYARDGRVVLMPEALESILAKELHYTGSLYPLCSIIRTRKFIKRGWHINAGQFLKMGFQLSMLDLTDINVLEEQLTGVDAAYFRRIIEVCTEKMEADESFKITAPYLSELVDRIFG